MNTFYQVFRNTNNKLGQILDNTVATKIDILNSDWIIITWYSLMSLDIRLTMMSGCSCLGTGTKTDTVLLSTVLFYIKFFLIWCHGTSTVTMLSHDFLCSNCISVKFLMASIISLMDHHSGWLWPNFMS